VSEYIDASARLVVNSGDLAFDGPAQRDDLNSPKRCMMRSRRLPHPTRQSRYRDNPTKVGQYPLTPSPNRPAGFPLDLREDRWRFDAAGWCFIGLNQW